MTGLISAKFACIATGDEVDKKCSDIYAEIDAAVKNGEYQIWRRSDISLPIRTRLKSLGYGITSIDDASNHEKGVSWSISWWPEFCEK